MIVVSDTGPLHYLGLIGQATVLEPMFGQVVVPTSVAQELSAPQTPEVVRNLIQPPPSWLVLADDPDAYHDAARSLGRGEQAAISLAHQHAGSLLLCDDEAARKTAQSLNIAVVGTLGIILEAGLAGHLDFEASIDALTHRTNFHYAKSLIAHVRETYAKRSQD